MNVWLRLKLSKSVQIQQVKSAEKSWKDEYLNYYIYCCILVAHFIPPVYAIYGSRVATT
jgi:hypothetical protein